jgi:hypothetical protein
MKSRRILSLMDQCFKSWRDWRLDAGVGWFGRGVVFMLMWVVLLSPFSPFLGVLLLVSKEGANLPYFTRTEHFHRFPSYCTYRYRRYRTEEGGSHWKIVRRKSVEYFTPPPTALFVSVVKIGAISHLPARGTRKSSKI